MCWWVLWPSVTCWLPVLAFFGGLTSWPTPVLAHQWLLQPSPAWLTIKSGSPVIQQLLHPSLACPKPILVLAGAYRSLCVLAGALIEPSMACPQSQLLLVNVAA